ncbi:IS3 family transposase [Testudinibacter sp. P80/BLE/0925]|uniref:IS3 family transposase n=1 Tax=Testudinibacter sp. TW-1 TaxID=3417757 RepID=UPI003D369F51
MTKYTQAFKQHTVEYYFQHAQSLSQTSKHVQVAPRCIRHWVAQYQHAGSDGLRVKHTARKFTVEEKLQAVKLARQGLFSLEHIALTLGISGGTVISKWLQRFKQFGINGLIDKPKGRPAVNKPNKSKKHVKPLTPLKQLEQENLRLRAENAILKKSMELFPERRSRKAEIVKALNGDFPLNLLLDIIKLARSTYFYHQQPKTDKEADLKAEIRQIKRENPQYGYRRVTLALGTVNHKKVQRLIQMMGLQVKERKKRKYCSYRGEVGRIADNLLVRHFTAENAYEKLVTDVTEFKAKDGNKVYLSPILDLFNNEVIAYQLGRRPNRALVEQMLRQAVNKLPKEATPILHSDQGRQYQMPSYRKILADNQIQISMSRKGNCLDNGAMESFFGRLKTECFYVRQFDTADDIEQAIHQYMQYYNTERIQVRLKGLSPIQYRIQSFH